jgi:hypothetical protein
MVDNMELMMTKKLASALAWYKNDETSTLASMISKSSKSFSGDLCLGMHGTSEPAHAKSTEMTNLY